MLELKIIERNFSVCKLTDAPAVCPKEEFYFLSRTDEELSLVCETVHVPYHVLERDDGWKAFRIQGVLDFSLIGILAKLSGILAENKIGIFAISTYNTDYILTKEVNYDRALNVLKEAGYKIV